MIEPAVVPDVEVEFHNDQTKKTYDELEKERETATQQEELAAEWSIL